MKGQENQIRTDIVTTTFDRIKKYIADKRIAAELIDHSGSDGLTSRDAASATGEDISNIIKVLCFIDHAGTKCFVIVQGNKKVDTRKIPGLKKPRLATSDELKNWFNAEPGAIPPIALPATIPKYVDAEIEKLRFVIGSAGSRFVGLKIDPKYIICQPNTIVLPLTLKGTD